MNKEKLNHNERYNVYISDGKTSVIDTFSDATVASTANSPESEKFAIALCSLSNIYWREVISLREKLNS